MDVWGTEKYPGCWQECCNIMPGSSNLRKYDYSMGIPKVVLEVKVNIEELRSYRQGKMSINFKENVPGLDAVKPVVGELGLMLDASGVRLAGCVKTLLRLNCHRCLRTYFQALTVDIDERFVHQQAGQVRRERELTRDDFVEPIPEDGVIDIGDVVYQAVTLATPTYCFCGESCPGPPEASGYQVADLIQDNTEESKLIDPRWQNLKTLFPNEETG